MALLTAFAAALERVPGIKPDEVEEVFFGNVLSAKSVLSYLELTLC